MKTRNIAPLNGHLENKLNNYSSTARASAVAAAAAGVLALPQLAQAHPVYTPANQDLVGPYNLYQIDLNNDGVNDVSINVVAYGNVGSGYVFNVGSMGAIGAQTGNAITVTPNGKYAAVGKRGDVVGPSDSFQANALMASFFSEFGTGGFSTHRQSGPWFNRNGFLGVKFLINGETHYGWLRIKAGEPGYSLLTGYAYETEANTPITCGFKKYDGVTMTPTPHETLPAKPNVHKVVPSNLGRLAIGAGGTAHSGSNSQIQSK